jgi:hypothetical protein
MSDDRTQNPFTKAVADQMARAAATLEGYAKLEEQMWEHYRTAIDESARLSKEAMAYAAATAAQMRKLSVEATKRATESMFP